MVQILSSSDTHRIVFHPAANSPSERLVVTFAPRTDPFANEGFGTRFMLKRGQDTIYVASHKHALHQGIGHEELAEIILPVAKGREILAYGNSVGAYAALYFGGILDARILAIAPRNTLHPILTRTPKLTAQKFTHRRALTEVPKSAHAPVVLFDPLQPKDARFFSEWVRPAYPEAEVHPVPMGGHGLIAKMQQAGELKPLVEGFLAGRLPERISIWEKDSLNRHFTEGYLLQRAGRHAEALQRYDEAFRLGRPGYLLSAMSSCAKQTGDSDRAKMMEAEMRAAKTRRRAKKRAARAV